MLNVCLALDLDRTFVISPCPPRVRSLYRDLPAFVGFLVSRWRIACVSSRRGGSTRPDVRITGLERTLCGICSEIEPRRVGCSFVKDLMSTLLWSERRQTPMPSKRDIPHVESLYRSLA